MNLKAKTKALLPSLIELLLKPKEFWKKRADNGFEDNVFILIYIPLILMSSIAAFLGELLWSKEFMFSYAVGLFLRELTSSFITLFLSAFVINKLAANYNSKAEHDTIYRVLTYSMVPIFITSTIVNIAPFLSPITIAGLYTFYLFYQGVSSCMKVPEENLSRFTLLSIVLLVFIAGSTYAMSWSVFEKLFPHGI